MTAYLRSAYRAWVAVLFLAVWVQVAAAAYGGFYAHHQAKEHGPLTKKAIDSGFDFHSAFGYFIFLGGVLLFLLALGARLGRRRILFSLALALLVIVQILLAEAGKAAPWAGGFHGAVALVIFAMTGSMAFAAWRRRRSPAA